MKITIGNIDFQIREKTDDFDEIIVADFHPINGNSIVNNHPDYFKYRAKIDTINGSINFDAIEVDTGHYDNSKFKTWSFENNPFIWFSIQMNSFNDKILFQTENSVLKIQSNDSIKFLMSDKTIIEFTGMCNNKKIKSGDLKLSQTELILTQNQIESLKKNKFEKWKFQSGDSNFSFEGGKMLAHPFRVSERIYATIHIYDFLVNKYFPNHNRFEDNDFYPTKTSEEKCFLYLMKDLANGYHKVGISNNPEYREKTLQSEKPTIELIYVKEFSTRKIAMSIESALHKTFDNKRLRGEWFDFSEKDIFNLKEYYI